MISRLILLTVLPVLLLACVGGKKTAPPAARRSPLTSGELATERAFGLLHVDVALQDGTMALALVDTGANASAIEERRSWRLPTLEPTEVLGTTGSFVAETVRLEGLRLGELELPALRATRRDLSGLLRPDGRSVVMILGSDAFAGRTLTIDFRRETLELGPSPSGARRWYPMVLDEGIPAVEARMAGNDTLLRIDTGASLFDTDDVYVNVPERLWDRIRREDPTLAPTSMLGGVGASGEKVDLPVIPFAPLLVGGREWSRAFLIVQPPSGYFARPDAKGFVSNNLLSKLGVVHLDYERRRWAWSEGTP